MTSYQQSKNEDQFQALLDTVENLRKSHFPSLDANVVREILQLHVSGLPADAEVSRLVEQAVEKQLAKENAAC